MGRPKSQFTREIERARQEGFDEGLNKGHADLLEFLRSAYLDAPDRPDRGTPKGDAILEMAQEASQHFFPEIKIGARS